MTTTVTTPGSSTSVDVTGNVSTSLDSDTSGTETESTTTTGGEPTGRASMILRADLETPGLDELFRVDYVDGVVTKPIKISGRAGDGIAQTQLSESETKLFYRPFDGAGSRWMYIPLEDGEAGSVSPVNQPPAPESGAIATPTLFADESRVAYWAADDASSTNEAIYLADITNQAVAAPVVAVETPPAGEGIGTDLVVSASGEWMSHEHSIDNGAANAWILPISPLDPEAAVQVSDLDQATQRVSSPARFVPGEQAVWYRADRDIDQVNEIFLVDISGPSPAAPVKVNDPLAPEQHLNPTRLSPDETRLAYFVGEDFRGDVYVVTFEGTTASAPIDVTPGDSEAYAQDLEWSPDGQWLSYSASYEQPNAIDLYVVDVSGAVPSEPMLVTAPGVVPDGDIEIHVFDPAGGWLYVIATVDSMYPELYRCDLSSGTPGELQKVSGELVDGGWLPGTILLSHDSSRVLYHATQDDPDVLELYMVDVSGAEPGASMKVNAPLAADEQLRFSASWSGDDSAIVYQTQTVPDQPQPVWIVGADALGQAALVADNADGVIMLDHVP